MSSENEFKSTDTECRMERRYVNHGLGGLRHRLAVAGEATANFVFPPRCAGCGRRGHWVCGRCLGQFPVEEQMRCARCGAQWCLCARTPFASGEALAYGPHDEWLRTAILRYKYHGEWARKTHLGLLLVPILAGVGEIDAIVPVPLHKKRLAWRGYNQAALLAEVAGGALGIPVMTPLVRTRATGQQVVLAPEERHRNVAGAFAVTGPARGHLVVIDDVITTGATARACRDALLAGGAARVTLVSLAHGG